MNNIGKFTNIQKIVSSTLIVAFTWLNVAPLQAQTNLPPPNSADFYKSDAATRAVRNKSNALWRIFVPNETVRAAAKKIGTIVADYGSFVIVAASENAQSNGGLEKVRLETDINLPGAKFEPLGDDGAARAVNFSEASGEADYFIVQFAAPATDEWLESVRNAGAEILQYVPHQAFFVHADGDAIEKISRHFRVRWVGRYLPEYKISPVLNTQLARAHTGESLNANLSPLEKTAAGKGLFDVAIFSRADFDAVQMKISNIGGKVLSASKLSHNYFNSVQVEIALDRVEELAKLRDVVQIDAFISPQAEDERAAQIIAGNYISTTMLSPPGYNPLTQFGVNGNNVTVAVVDDGIGIPGDGGFYITAANTVNGPLRGAAAGASGHGHLNASIIAGTTPFSTLDPMGYNYGLGIAPAAHLINIPYLRAGYTGTDANLANDTVSTNGVNGVKGSISNNSWGAGTNDNAYDSRASAYDGFVRDASIAATIDPLLVVFSAGNDGTSGLTRPKVAKNVIAVGSSENLRTELGGTAANNIDDIAGSSSRGPAADGRIKPDITAPGATISGGRSGPNSLFGNIDDFHRRSSGTSHAAPQIAGAAALFTQFWKNGNGGANPSPALIKAALINSTIEINGVGSSATIPNGAEGWGRLNMKGMLNTGFPIQYVNQTTPLSDVGQNINFSHTVADATKPLRVSLIWTDPPGVSDPSLVNNLDLTVTVGGNTYRGNVFTGGTSTTGGTADNRNNVENVFLPAGTPVGTPISVQITATALNGDGILGNADLTDQHFALVVSNANIGPNACRLQRRSDFDGDSKSDISVFRPENGTWHLLNSSSGFSATQFGASTDKAVPADYDGDGKTDLAVYRAGVWYLQRSTEGFLGVSFGTSEDVPQPSDFDGDGRAELAVFRPSNGTWYVMNLMTNQFSSVQFGAIGDKPVVADYDGDCRADYAVFRPSVSTWYLQQSTQGFTAIQFGVSTDTPVQADYDGDGKTDVAVFRASNATWYLQQSTQGFTGEQFGNSTDLPVPADYDGDGKADVAVFRPSNVTWYLQQSTQGFKGVQFGESTDRPTPNAFVP